MSSSSTNINEKKIELKKIDLKKEKKYISTMNNTTQKKIEIKKIEMEKKNKSTSTMAHTMKSTNKEKKHLNINKHNKSMETNIELKKIDLKNKNKTINNTMASTSTNTQLKKIDLENTKNNKAIMMNTNCKKTTKHFDTTMYYNIANAENAKVLKKDGKYTSPMAMAISTRNDDEFTLKFDEEKGAKTYTKYGNMTYENLDKYAWKINNHLFEIVPKGQPFKLYFDIDKRYENEENNEIIMKKVYELTKEIMGLDMGKCDIAVCYGKGQRDDYIKVSWHIIVNNGIYFKNMDECKKVMKHMEYTVITNDKYDELRGGVLDFNVYKDNQAFKLPYQSKAFKKIIQKPTEQGKKLSDYLLSNVKGGTYYDVSKFTEIDTKKKTVKCANGKQMTLNFDEAIVFKQYVEAIGKTYKLGKIQGSKKDGLPYYLNSIPNNEKVPRAVWKMIGWCISRITKNSEEGLNLWAKWTSGYKATSSEDLREAYMGHSIDKGYGWKTLYNLARIFNKNMDNNESIFDPLFDDQPTFKMTQEIIKSRYNGTATDIKKMVKENQVIAIKAPMGCGKSYDLRKIFEERDNYGDYVYPSICYYSCKRAFASSMVADFEEHGFVNYLDVEEKHTIKDIDRIICSVESIHWARDKYDIVIIDESESIADNLMGEMFKKNKPIECSINIYDMIKNSSKVMIMDAYITTRSFNMIKDIMGKDIENKKCHYLINEYQYEPREYYDLDKELFVNAIKAHIEEGKRCAVVCGSKKLSEYIKDSVECDMKAYDNSNPLPNTCDVNKEWRDCQLLIYTPTITAGISYDPKVNGKKDIEKHFDNLFIYCVNKGSCHFRDTIQAHKRVRDFKSNKVYICINDKFKGHKYDMMPLTKEGVLEMEEKYKQGLFGEGANAKSLKMYEDCEGENVMSYIHNINIHNKLEQNISQLCLRGFAKKYLYLENIKQVSSQTCDEYLELDDEVWNFDEIEDIDVPTWEQIKYKMEYQGIDKPTIEDEEMKQYMKFNYKHKQVKSDISEDVRKEFFNEYYSMGKQERDRLGSVRSFKQMLNDIKYDFTKFAQWQLDKDSQRNQVIEMYDMKLKRYEHLIGFFHKLGFIKEDKIDIDNEFVGDDFKKMEETYKNVDVKVLNSMMNDGYIRITKKKPTSTDLNTKQIKGIFNQLLKDEFGMEVVSNGLKYIRVDGKKKKLTKMCVRNYCPKEIQGASEEYVKAKMDKFGSSEYNRFNVYKEKFSEDLPQGIVCDFMDESDDEEDDEIMCNTSDEDNEDNEVNILGDLLDDSEDEDEVCVDGEMNIIEEPKKEEYVIKMKPKKVKMGNQNIICGGGCRVCGKPTLLSTCSKCLMATN